ncbi:UBP14 [Hepatospora eriocheir]|uniref:UBP14 n=1 Tax=Hepatospora eriocheir TaxID=1081669 RepID=A0A1X0Q8Q7_9MICR|nr:UBP14 [Hepatospora eriocheir]
MIDLTQFESECNYCYNNINDETLFYCECTLTTCKYHYELHFKLKGCLCLFNVTNENNNLMVNNLVSEDDLTNQVLVHLNKNDDTIVCPHFSGDVDKNVIDILDKQCNECDINDNVWKCLECGYVGCGRNQYGIEGNNHMFNHYKSTDHFRTLSLNSKSDYYLKVYCYKCDYYIKCDLSNINFNTTENRNFNLININLNNSNNNFDKKSIKGITNNFNNCYISTVLHLLSNIYDENLDNHFNVCDYHPIDCFMCQFIKVINGLNKGDKNILNIDPFINIISKSDIFIKYQQYDASEFLYYVFDKFEFYYQKGTIPNLLERLYFNTKKISGTIFFNEFVNNLNEIQLDGTFNDFLIICIKRYNYENHETVKINDPIECDDLVINDEKYSFICSILHEGTVIESGHYLYYDNVNYLIVNDELVNEVIDLTSVKAFSYIYLFRK